MIKLKKLLDETKKTPGRYIVNEDEFSTGKDDIKSTLDSLGIQNYTVNSDSTVDVKGDVYLNLSKLNNPTIIPIKFRKVDGYFKVKEGGNLISLDGAPEKVGGDFICEKQKLTTLEGAPREVGGAFNCSYNKLKNLKFAPKVVGSYFSCSNNELTSLEGAPQKIGSGFTVSNNQQLISLKGSPKNVSGRFDASDCGLVNLEGGPIMVRALYDVSGNKLKSLKGAPREAGSFDCSNNPALPESEKNTAKNNIETTQFIG